MLTETRFKELYEQAERLRALGGSAAAGELLLYLFDHGRSVGGYGVVRLSFVLRDLAALADLANPRPDPDAQRIRRSLEKRRDERERLATLGEASFADLQELVALHRALGEPGRSRDLNRMLATLGDASDEIAAVRKVLTELIGEKALVGDAERIALQYELERLKRRLLELNLEVAKALDGSEGAKAEVPRLEAGLLEHCNRLRRADVRDLPRGEREKREVAELAEEAAEIVRRQEEGLASATTVGEARVRLAQLTQQLGGLGASHGLAGGFDLLRDREIRAQLLRMARDTAERIAEIRISEDLEGDLAAEQRKEHAARIRHDGLLVYEALLRIGEGTLAGKVGAWMVSFAQAAAVSKGPEAEIYKGLAPEIYRGLAEAAKRAREPAIERRFRELAQRPAKG